jgi:hypothetical protein
VKGGDVRAVELSEDFVEPGHARENALRRMLDVMWTSVHESGTRDGIEGSKTQ